MAMQAPLRPSTERRRRSSIARYRKSKTAMMDTIHTLMIYEHMITSLEKHSTMKALVN